jgi:hypothetical protein
LLYNPYDHKCLKGITTLSICMKKHLYPKFQYFKRISSLQKTSAKPHRVGVCAVLQCYFLEYFGSFLRIVMRRKKKRAQLSSSQRLLTKGDGNIPVRGDNASNRYKNASTELRQLC